jgi:hypothetical protein
MKILAPSSVLNGDLTENFCTNENLCTNNDNVGQLEQPFEKERPQ